jgi:hypothetical protein
MVTQAVLNRFNELASIAHAVVSGDPESAAQFPNATTHADVELRMAAASGDRLWLLLESNTYSWRLVVFRTTLRVGRFCDLQ